MVMNKTEHISEEHIGETLSEVMCFLKTKYIQHLFYSFAIYFMSVLLTFTLYLSLSVYVAI